MSNTFGHKDIFGRSIEVGDTIGVTWRTTSSIIVAQVTHMSKGRVNFRMLTNQEPSTLLKVVVEKRPIPNYILTSEYYTTKPNLTSIILVKHNRRIKDET